MFVVIPWPELVPSVFVRVDLFVFIRLVFVCSVVFVPFVLVQFDYLVFLLFVFAVLDLFVDQILVGQCVLMLLVQL